jgi:hypothetical protein
MEGKMKRTYLIQRLIKARKNKEGVLSTIGEGFSFGGGMMNGGLSPKAMDLLRPIFGFDYMGASEFEFGAVPETMSEIAKSVKEYGKHEIKLADHTVYIFCKNEDINEIKRLIKDIYKDEYKLSLKEYPRLKDSLGEKAFTSDIIGWLELDNNFFFFKDKEAFDKLTELFKD